MLLKTFLLSELLRNIVKHHGIVMYRNYDEDTMTRVNPLIYVKNLEIRGKKGQSCDIFKDNLDCKYLKRNSPYSLRDKNLTIKQITNEKGFVLLFDPNDETFFNGNKIENHYFEIIVFKNDKDFTYVCDFNLNDITYIKGDLSVSGKKYELIIDNMTNTEMAKMLIFTTYFAYSNFIKTFDESFIIEQLTNYDKGYEIEKKERNIQFAHNIVMMLSLINKYKNKASIIQELEFNIEKCKKTNKEEDYIELYKLLTKVNFL